MIKFPHMILIIIVLMMGVSMVYAKDSNPKVLILTSMGEIEVELFTLVPNLTPH